MPRLTYLIAAYFLMVVPATVAAEELPDAELARLAEAAFQKGVQLRSDRGVAQSHFQEAAHYFEELRQRGASHPHLYLDLGHAQLLSGDVAAAIVSYRRGLRLAPHDEPLQVALDTARDQVNYPIEGALGKVLPREASLMARVTPSLLWTIAFSAYFSACLLWTRSKMRRRFSLFVFGMAFLLLAAATTVWGIVVFQEDQKTSATIWIVMKKEGQRLRKGGGWLSHGEPAFPARYAAPLPAGVEAKLLCERAEWVQLELSSGEIGWVPKESVVAV